MGESVFAKYVEDAPEKERPPVAIPRGPLLQPIVPPATPQSSPTEKLLDFIVNRWRKREIRIQRNLPVWTRRPPRQEKRAGPGRNPCCAWMARPPSTNTPVRRKTMANCSRWRKVAAVAGYLDESAGYWTARAIELAAYRAHNSLVFWSIGLPDPFGLTTLWPTSLLVFWGDRSMTLDGYWPDSLFFGTAAAPPPSGRQGHGQWGG